ncbi:MAG TPA: phosphoadenosine phosphosulfate reductase family protein [Caldisericia bacterium]|nr:phosphoadenosine phosphosulfate reductase family protein [Caldisericia bacterium]
MTCFSNFNYINKKTKNNNLILKIKINEALKIIKTALAENSNPVIAFSGGKDSLVVLDLVRSLNGNIAGIFENTGNEYPETVEYVHTIDNVVELHPDISFWECARKYGLPVMKSKAKSHGNQCCKHLKEYPFRKYCKEHSPDVVFTGLTSDESRNRMMMLKRMGNYYYHKSEKINKCHPIADWSDQDVWDYIKFKNLEYNPIYDLGIPRCGCRFCTAYLSWKDVTARYNIKDTQTLMKFQGYKLLSDYE